MTNEDVAPHNLQAERAVLGAVLIDQSHLTMLLAIGLRPAHFYRQTYGWAFQAMIDCDDAGTSIDTLTVADALDHSGHLAEVGGTQGIDEFLSDIPTAGHSKEYGVIVRRLWERRDLIRTSHEIRQAAIKGEKTVLEIVHIAEQQIDQIVLDIPSAGLGPLPFDDEVARAERVQSNQVDPGMVTGYKDLDRLIGGWQDDSLVVIAARPAMGKSAIVTAMADAALRTGAPVAIFSLEMSKAEILRRMLSTNANVHGDNLLRGPLSPNQLDRVREASDKLSKLSLYVDEGVDAGIYDLRARARRLNARLPFGLGLIIVDYLQLLRAENPKGNRVAEIGFMTRGLKTLARELHVPVIAISQLNRALEQRGDKRPVLSDLRESGSIEQDADLVLFLHRPGYYDDKVDISETELSVAKHRNGRLGSIELTFIAEFPKFISVIKLDSQSDDDADTPF